MVVDLPCAVMMRGKSFYVEQGNQLLFPESIYRIDNEEALSVGGPIFVKDGNSQLIGWGVFNPNSQYRIRMMQIISEIPKEQECVMDMKRLLHRRIREAVNVRSVLKLPSEHTNTYRLVNSDGDKLSGMIVDVYGDHMVVSPSAAWLELTQKDVVDALRQETGISNIYWRPSNTMFTGEGLPSAGANPCSVLVFFLPGTGNGFCPFCTNHIVSQYLHFTVKAAVSPRPVTEKVVVQSQNGFARMEQQIPVISLLSRRKV